VFALAADPGQHDGRRFGVVVVDGMELEELGEAVRIHSLQIDDDLFLSRARRRSIRPTT